MQMYKQMEFGRLPPLQVLSEGEYSDSPHKRRRKQGFTRTNTNSTSELTSEDGSLSLSCNTPPRDADKKKKIETDAASVDYTANLDDEVERNSNGHSLESTTNSSTLRRGSRIRKRRKLSTSTGPFYLTVNRQRRMNNHVVKKCDSSQSQSAPRVDRYFPPSHDPLKMSKMLTKMTGSTKFLLGSTANSMLGLATARGRIYSKHPELFRYHCDADDKEWLVTSSKMTSHGVKAYLMLLEELLDLANQDSAYGNTLLAKSDNAQQMRQQNDDEIFTLPPWLLDKVRATFSPITYSGDLSPPSSLVPLTNTPSEK
ncbi:Deoxynucleotidyltransferase terminal-interacting protein 1, partial [Cichlidogyrus casuarinus]